MKERLNFSKDFKLYKACSNDLARPAMNYVYFMNGCAYASDSHILVKIPLENCTFFADTDSWKLLEGYAIHYKMLKMVYGFDAVHIERDDESGICRIVTNFEGHEISFQLKRAEDLRPPKFDKVLSSGENADPVKRIGINPRLLVRLAEAANLGQMALYFRGERGVIHIEEKITGLHAVIAPCLITD